MNPELYLFRSRRFLPLFTTQFLIGFCDNLLRYALIILITYKIASTKALGASPEALVIIASALLVTPYIIFSSIAGQLADKYERSRLMRITKSFELVVMILAAIGFWYNDVHMLLGLLFLAGTQASFFSPMKYSVLPDHLHKHELMVGNSFLEGGTFLAILLGTILGTQLGKFLDITEPLNSLYVSIPLVACSALGLFTCFFIPRANPADPTLKITKNIVVGTIKMVGSAVHNKPVFAAILGTSWFWLTGSVIVAQLPIYTREVLNANTDVLTLFSVIFSFGIVAGSIASGYLLKGEISARLAPISLLGVAIFIFIMVAATQAAPSASDAIIAAKQFINANPDVPKFSAQMREFIDNNMQTPEVFFQSSANIIILICMFGLSFCAGAYASATQGNYPN